jgi:hypothetical protein
MIDGPGHLKNEARSALKHGVCPLSGTKCCSVQVTISLWRTNSALGGVRRPQRVGVVFAQLSGRPCRELHDKGWRMLTWALLRRATVSGLIAVLPLGGFVSVVENWRQLPDGQIEFTARHLPTWTEDSN